ncbi:MAG: hypothetical protein AB7D51_11680 [Desulfovibrionaceae bacterium]
MSILPACEANEKHVAWDGLSLAVPEEWEPGLLGPGSLRLDHRSGPALELRWAASGGLPAGEQIARAARELRGARLFRAGEPGVPPDWNRAVRARADKGGRADRNVEAEPFAWHDENTASRGLGAALRWRRSGAAALALFFLSPGDESCELPGRVLGSLNAHFDEDETPWAVFGLSASVPTRLGLERQEFVPGRFQLLFRQRREGFWPLLRPARLVLERFGPASVLLGAGESRAGGPSPLSLWVEKQYKKPLPGAGFWQPRENGLVLRQVGGSSRRMVRHDPGSNKILAVTLREGGREDMEAFERICRNYATT